LVRPHAEFDSLVLAGHSAGGQLALWATSRLVAAGTPVRGVLALAAVCDLAEAYRLDLDGGAVGDLLGGGPEEVPDRYAAGDPLALLPLGVPVRLLHGMTDEIVPVEFSRRYQAVAQLAGDRVALTELPDTGHFPVIDPRSAAWPTVLAELRAVAPP
jgi:pimeloyl-ACP methyl ester carboxylesterase